MLVARGYRLIVFHCSVDQIEYFNRFLLFRKDILLPIPKYFRIVYLGKSFQEKLKLKVSTTQKCKEG